MILTELYESSHSCPECGGPAFSDLILAEKQDACYHKVRSRYKVWPSAYASGALVQCRKKGAANWGNKSESMEDPVGEYGQGVSEARRNRTDWEMDAELWFKEIDGKMWQTSIFPNQRAQARAEGWAPSKQEARDMAYIRGLAPKDKPSVTEDFSDVVKGVKRAIKGKPSLQQTLDKHYDKAYAYDRQGGQYDLDAIAKSVRLSDREHQKALRLIDKFMRSPVKNVAEDSSPQVGDAVYYGTRLVGWFKGYSEHGKIITEPNEEEMGDEYSNRDVYWDPQDKITIKPETGVAEDSVDHRKLGKHHEEMTDQELRKVGSKLPDSWDGARFRRKLASHPKYAQALKHYDKSEYHFGKAAKQGVTEGAHWSDEWEPVQDIKTKTGQVVGMVMRHSSGTYAYYDNRKSNIESGFSSADQARQAFVELHNARVRSNNPGVAEGKDIENYHHTGPGADKKAQAHAKRLGPDWAAYRHPSAAKWDNLHIVVKKNEAPKDLQSLAEGLDAEEYKEKLLATLPQMMRFYEKNVQGWKPSKEQMLAAVETGYTVMKHTGDVKQAGKAVMDELNTLHRMSHGQQGVAEGSNDKPEAGDKIVWYYSNHHPKLEGEVVGWKDGHLLVKSIDPSPRNTEKSVATYRVPKNNILNVEKRGVAEGLANANETLRSQIIRLYKKGLEDYDIAYDLDIDEKTVADIIDDYDKKQQQRQSKVAEGYKFKGGFPFDVDHMPGAVHRNADMITDNVKTNDKTHWARAVDSINARVFDDMSEFSTDSHGETVTGNGAVWAKWDNATQTGWFNAEGRPLRTWAVKEQGVEEGFGDIFKKRKNPADGIRVSNGIAYTGDKVNVEGYPKIEGVVSFTHHHNGKIAVMLYPKGHRPMALAVEPSRVSIKQGVAEGIFDRFKKKSSKPTPADPGKYPQRDNVDQWMIDTVEYYKATSPNSVWKLFCPSWADYLPVRVRVGTSSEVMRKHMDTYLKLRAENPEAAQVARQNFDPDHVYPSGPADDYRVNEQSAESIKNQMPVEAWGYRYDRRDQRVAWRKQFSELSAAEKWAALNNATMLGYKTISDMSEGWKGEFAGGTAGSLAGGIAGSSAGASVGPTVGGTIGGLAGGLPGAIAGMAAGAAAGPVVGAAMGGTAGGMVGGRIGDRLGGEPAKEDATTVKEIAPVVVAAGRLAAPWVAKKIADRVRAARATPSTPATNPDVDEPDEHMQEAGSKKSKELVGDRYEPSDFDAMLARVRQLAGAGELKTVWDPTRRTYRNMPTAQQPKDKK